MASRVGQSLSTTFGPNLSPIVGAEISLLPSTKDVLARQYTGVPSVTAKTHLILASPTGSQSPATDITLVPSRTWTVLASILASGTDLPVPTGNRKIVGPNIVLQSARKLVPAPLDQYDPLHSTTVGSSLSEASPSSEATSSSAIIPTQKSKNKAPPALNTESNGHSHADLRTSSVKKEEHPDKSLALSVAASIALNRPIAQLDIPPATRSFTRSPSTARQASNPLPSQPSETQQKLNTGGDSKEQHVTHPGSSKFLTFRRVLFP